MELLADAPEGGRFVSTARKADPVAALCYGQLDGLDARWVRPRRSPTATTAPPDSSGSRRATRDGRPAGVLPAPPKADRLQPLPRVGGRPPQTPGGRPEVTSRDMGPRQDRVTLS